MNTEIRTHVPQMPSSAAMIRTLGTIAMISGLLVVLVYQYTLPIIRTKERLALERAVYRVIPGVDSNAATRVTFALGSEGITELDEHAADEANLYAVYDASGDLAGIAMEGAAQGYQDIVRTLYGFNPDCECIVGMTVLKSTDTPGLGDKETVERNSEFMKNFAALDARLTNDKTAVAHPIETVKHGSKTEPWQVDAMSGATVTSRAIGNGLRKSTNEMLPLLSRHLNKIKVRQQ